MPKKARKVKQALESKGFARDESHHTFFRLIVDGKKTGVWTKVSQGTAEIDDGLLGAMARQVSLSRRDFLQLVDCPLTAERYIEMLREGQVIDPAPASDDERRDESAGGGSR